MFDEVEQISAVPILLFFIIDHCSQELIFEHGHKELTDADLWPTFKGEEPPINQPTLDHPASRATDQLWREPHCHHELLRQIPSAKPGKL